MSQLGMFDPEPTERPVRIGHADVEYADSSSILTKASGFMGDYDFTLNPYSGCSFGCTYCYAAFFSHERELQDSWGRWVKVKQNALQKLDRMRTPLTGKRIYMSSVTDPYQPIERHLELVRSILVRFVEMQPRLVVQTRSGLVTRDIDLLGALEHVRVNMTITTDDDEVRRAFEPWCPTNKVRLDAISEVAGSGIPTSITMTPLLPVAEPEAFAEQLLTTGVTDFVVQPFHEGQSRFVAGTREAATALVRERSWTSEDYEQTVAVLRRALPKVTEGRSGFAPA